MKEKMVQLFKNKKVLAVLSVVLVAILVVVLSNSYALFQRQLAVGNANLQVGELQYSMSSTSLNENNAITVEAGKSVTFDIMITSLNDISSKYELYYNCDSNDVTVGYLTTTVDPVVGETTKNETKTISVKIINNSSTSQTIVFGVEGGFTTSELSLTKGKTLVELEDIVLVPATNTSELLSDSTDLGDSCKTYNDGTDTFLVGQCSKNYVWYSGKLWRAVLSNNNSGAIKMVTDNSMTIIPPIAETSNSYSNSYVDQWLTQEFLPTLHDTDTFLVKNSTWDASVDDGFAGDSPTGEVTVTRTVGLLNTKEYKTTYASSDGLAEAKTGYLNNDSYWWLMKVWYGRYDSKGTLYSALSDGTYSASNRAKYGLGVRPAVFLKSNIKIISGDGSQSNPYRLSGDNQVTKNGSTLLNTRYSGEYVKFNNSLYRIVGAENNLTKITAVDAPSELEEVPWHSKSVGVTFEDADIRTTLEKYYQAMDASAKNMIEPNTKWYFGAFSDGLSYKTAVCSSVVTSVNTSSCSKTTNAVTANIGLPRVGEIFTSHITRRDSDPYYYGFWHITRYITNTQQANIVSKYEMLSSQMISSWLAARPSMYLKSTVKISSSNTGDGTYEHPYDISL